MSKLFVVTGANKLNGIGFHIVKGLLDHGNVIATSRSKAAGEKALKELDLEAPESIDAFVNRLKEKKVVVDALINNAGFMSNEPLSGELAKKTLAVNYFGTVELTKKMLPLLNDNARVVNISSGMGELRKDKYESKKRKRFLAEDLAEEELVAYARDFIDVVSKGEDPLKHGYRDSAYGFSKALLNHWSRIFKPKNVAVQVLCPGWVRTDMGGSGASLTPSEGADTPIWLATSNDIPGSMYETRFWRRRKEISW